MTRRQKISQTLALRARIVLLCADTQASDGEIARQLRIIHTTVAQWRSRFPKIRLDGLLDEPRPAAAR